MITINRILLFASLFLTLIVACKKTTRNINHENNIVEGGNQIPPYNGVTTIEIRNYVNKLNIDLIGVEPDAATLDQDVESLKAAKLSIEERTKIVQRMVSEQGYFDRLAQLSSILMINGMDRNEINGVLDEQVFVKDFLLSSGDTTSAQIVAQEILRLEQLLAARDEYRDGTIDIGEFFARYAYNLIFDEINMGSENFVIACFENLLKRYPTEEELAAGVEMVDGQNAIVLFHGGNSKLDFVGIITSSTDFKEGRIVDAYESLVLRKPTSKELTDLQLTFGEDNDYEKMLIEILTTDEYAGFEL